MAQRFKLAITHEVEGVEQFSLEAEYDDAAGLTGALEDVVDLFERHGPEKAEKILVSLASQVPGAKIREITTAEQG
jgi:hypothetical protein